MCLLGLVRVVDFMERSYSVRSLPTLILPQINTPNHMLSAKNTDLIPQQGQRQLNRVGDAVKIETSYVSDSVRPTCFLQDDLLGNSRCLREGRVLSVFL